MNRTDLPPNPPEPVRNALDAHEAIAQRARTSSHRLDHLAQDLEQAILEDRDAFAAAIRKGEPDPGPAAVTAVQDEINAATRELEALRVAQRQATDEVVAAVAASLPSWHVDAVKRRAPAARNLERAIDKLEEAIGQIAEISGTISFTERDPHERLYYSPVANGITRGLIARNGDPYPVAQVLAEFRSFAARVAAGPAPARSAEAAA